MKITEKIKIPIKAKWFFTAAVFIVVTLSCSENQYVFESLKSIQKSNSHIDLNEIKQLNILKEREYSNTSLLFEKVNKQTNQTSSAKFTNKLLGSLSIHHQIDSAYHNILLSAANDSLKNEIWQRLMCSAAFYINIFQQNDKFRNIINRGDNAYNLPKNWLSKMDMFYWKEENQNRAIAVGLIHDSSKDFNFSKTEYFFRKQSDLLSESAYQSAGFISKVTSNFLSLLNFESKRNRDTTLLGQNLKKWDLICLKNPKNLTDFFIPGYFGHIAIYMGNGIIAESVQPGVRYSSIADFTKDECSYLVIRPIDLHAEQTKKMELCLNAQIGKSYDYNYDIDSPDKLICTELIYLIFDQIKWDSKNILGRKIIYPDQIVKTAQNNPGFEFLFFLNSYSGLQKPDANLIAQLINQN